MFRFSIRELMLVTLVVGLGVGWWIDRSKIAAEFEAYRDDYAGFKLLPDGTSLAPEGWVIPKSYKGVIEPMGYHGPRPIAVPPESE